MNRVTAVQPPSRPWSEFKEPPAPLQSTSEAVHVASLKSRRSHVRTRGRGLVPAQSVWTPRVLFFEEVALENTGISPKPVKTMDI